MYSLLLIPIIALSVLYFIFTHHQLYLNDIAYKRVSRKHIANITLKTGDLIFFDRITHPLYKSVIYKTLFNDVTMVVMINGKPFLLRQDSFDPLDIIYDYPGHVYVMQLRNKLSPTQERVIQHEIDNHVHYEHNLINSLLRILCHHSQFPNKFTYEYIAYVLAKSEITDEPYICHTINVPNAIIKLEDTDIYDKLYDIIL